MTIDAKHIRLLALDVDGVLTDGKLYFSAQGDEMKAFSILDGLGLKMLMQSDVVVALITGRTSPLVTRRARDLGIEHIIQGREDKQVALLELLEELQIDPRNTAYMGDDLPDLGAISIADIGFTVPNAHDFVKQHADYCTKASGGEGAVREVCELILESKGLLNTLLQTYLP